MLKYPNNKQMETELSRQGFKCSVSVQFWLRQMSISVKPLTEWKRTLANFICQPALPDHALLFVSFKYVVKCAGHFSFSYCES